MSVRVTADETALMAHLLRRAGFGATPSELEGYLSQGYDAVVEELLHPQDPRNLPDDLIRRYHPEQSESRDLISSGAYWMYRMITTHCPLEEKIALFWHGLFATGYTKLNQARAQLNQIDMFRRKGLGGYRELLVELSKDPAMILWLDNNENHRDAVNENYGRELLELFSMGIGAYDEADVKEGSRAFTGWTLANAEYMAIRALKDSIWPYSRIAWHFEYREDDHDGGEKTFLGETGNFTGEDIIDIIVRQEATARFICTRLFQFFAADEIDEAGEGVIAEMVRTYFECDYEIGSGTSNAVHLRLFQVGRRPVRPREGAGRIDGRGHTLGGQLPDANYGHRQSGRPVFLHGPRPPPAAHGRRMARGNRVD